MESLRIAAPSYPPPWWPRLSPLFLVLTARVLGIQAAPAVRVNQNTPFAAARLGDRSMGVFRAPQHSERSPLCRLARREEKPLRWMQGASGFRTFTLLQAPLLPFVPPPREVL